MTIGPQQHPRSLNNEIVTRQMIGEINAEREKSDRLTVAKLNTVKQFNKQDYKSKLMTEKYSLLPLNSQQLTPVQTAIQRMSEKHLDFEIEPGNTIQPPVIKYMSCICKTTCFSVNCAPLSLQFGWNEEPKGSNRSRRSECGNRTPPSKLDTAPFSHGKASANQRLSCH